MLPIVDYASVVYHPLLTNDQVKAIEWLQMAALKIIFGWKRSYSEILDENKVETMAERRQRLTDKFVVKTAKNPVYQEKWFKLKTFTHHDLRKEKFYEEKYARTDRLYNSPVYYYRRHLNEIHSPD